jgi:putative membrane protein
MHTLIHLAVITATVLGLARFLPDVHVQSTKSAVVVALVFSALNFFLGWAIHLLLFLPAMLTLGLLFAVIPFIVNTVMLWLTDKLIASFEIKTTRALLISAGAITVVNWLLHVVVQSHHVPRLR